MYHLLSFLVGASAQSASQASTVSQVPSRSFQPYSFSAYPSISASPFQITNLSQYARPNSTQLNAVDGPPLELVHEL